MGYDNQTVLTVHQPEKLLIKHDCQIKMVKNQTRGCPCQEPAIPGFSVSITIPIPEKRSGRFRYRYRYQGWAKFDTDSDTDTKTLQML